jgi:hypothetical protein
MTLLAPSVWSAKSKSPFIAGIKHACNARLCWRNATFVVPVFKAELYCLETNKEMYYCSVQ